MTKKTKLIPFDWEKYKAGAKAVFDDGHSEILGIYETDCSSPAYPEYLVVFKNETCKSYCDKFYDNYLRLEQQLEEKTFYVNINQEMWGFSVHESYDEAYEYKHLKKQKIGTLKITYTEEDLIK